MRDLRVRGLRSLADTGQIRIAPITVLLGENSSGKSTFLRTFPLLRQSVEVRTSEPLLWFGRLVDFGTFEESASSFNTHKSVEIDISLDLDAGFSTSDDAAYFDPPPQGASCTVQFKITASPQEPGLLGALKTASHVSQLVIDTCGTKILLGFDSPNLLSRVEIDGNDFTRISQASYGVAKSISPTPTLYSLDRVLDEPSVEIGPNFRTFHEEVNDCVKSLVHGRTKDSSIDELITRFRLGTSEDMLKAIQEGQTQKGVWKRTVLDWTVENPEFIHYKQLIWGARLEEILDSVGRSIQREFSSISYITPLRAAAERYYRQQGLAVNELDSKGENFALFLRSLIPRDRESLRKWLGSSLNVYVELEESKGHVSLYLVDDKSKSRVNLADTGFGYSQLLPIAIQLWLTQTTRRPNSYPLRSNRAPVVVIEQPELHLHPRIQAKVADLLAHTVSIDKSSRKVSVIVETHSEALVNRLGKLISNKTLLPSDVNVVLFNKDTFSGPTNVVVTNFDSNGFLQDWPLGFFNSD